MATDRGMVSTRTKQARGSLAGFISRSMLLKAVPANSGREAPKVCLLFIRQLWALLTTSSGLGTIFVSAFPFLAFSFALGFCFIHIHTTMFGAPRGCRTNSHFIFNLINMLS